MATSQKVRGITRAHGATVELLRGGARRGVAGGRASGSSVLANERRIPGAKPGAPPPGQGIASTGPTAAVLSIDPWWKNEYESARDFMRHDFFIALAASSTTDAGLEFEVESGRRGVLKQVLIMIQNSTALTDVSIRLLLDGKPVQGWDDVPLLPAAVTFQALPYNELNVRMDQGQKLTAQFINRNITAWTVGLQLSGWTVSSADITRLSGGINY